MRMSRHTHFVISFGLISAVAASSGMAFDIFNGHFASSVEFVTPTGGWPVPSVLGSPNWQSPDLNGGGISLRFDASPTSFAYPVDVPLGTDLILVESDDLGRNVVPSLVFAYQTSVADADADGVFDGNSSSATLISDVLVAPSPYDPIDGFGSRYWFFDLGPNFIGVSSNFILGINDLEGGDLDIDAVQIIPAPGSVVFGFIAVCSGLRARRRD